MMRSPSKWAVAVRKPDGEIAEVVKDITSPMARRGVFRLPVVEPLEGFLWRADFTLVPGEIIHDYLAENP